MQIVIEISEEDYKLIKSYGEGSTNYHISLNLYDAVKNGTPLPKGHGRLIDADKLELDDGYSNYDGYYHKYSRSQIYNAPTVLEAERSESNGENN